MDSGKIAIAAGDAQDEQRFTKCRVNGITVCKSYSPVHQPMNSSKLMLPSPSPSVISNASPTVAVRVARVEALAQLGELVGVEIFHRSLP
jgi:hypothetical protein